MALTKVTGHVVKPDTNIQFHNTKSTGIVTFAHTNNATSSTTGALQVTGGVGIVKDLHVGGNVTVGGTLTYDDVTNIDSLGIITARGGIHIGPVTAGVATVYTNGNASFTGIVTATTFVGALTGTATKVDINSNNDSTAFRVPFASANSGSVFLYADNADGMTYNPSIGRLSVQQLEGTLQTAAQTNITSLGTLSSLTSSGAITAHDFRSGGGVGNTLYLTLSLIHI